MLGICDCSFPGRKTEEARVKHLNIFQNSGSPDISGIVQQFRRCAGFHQFLICEKRNRFLSFPQILPEFLCVPGIGKTAGHADDGDRFQGFVCFRVIHYLILLWFLFC